MTTPQALFGADLVAEWDATDASTLTISGGLVSEWRSRVGTIKGAQATSGLQPTYSATARNGKPGLIFNGSSSVLNVSPVSALPLGSSPSTTMVVVTEATYSGGYSGPFSYGSVGTGQRHGIGQVNADKIGYFGYASDLESTTTWGNSDRQVLVIIDASGNATIYDANTLLASGTLFTNVSNSAGYIGALLDSGLGYWNGVIQGIYVVQRDITTAERNSFYAYTAMNFGPGSVGTAAGTSTATATGQALFPAMGAAGGSSTATATGSALDNAVGTSAGNSTATGTAVSTKAAAGSSAGASTATGVGRATDAATGTAAGTSTASAPSIAWTAATGSSAGTSTATATANVAGQSTGIASGTSTATATGRANDAAVGSSASVSTANATAQANAAGVGAAAGSSTAIGVVAGASTGAGTAAGTSTASGVSIPVSPAVGTATGTSTATGASSAATPSAGAAAGTSTASATSQISVAGLGLSYGYSTANGQTSVRASATGSASGASSATAYSLGVYATGTAAGSSTAVAFGPRPKPTLDLTDDDIFDILGDFLTAILPNGTPIARGQANRVSEPTADDFVIMTPIRRTRLSTNTHAWDATTDQINQQRATQITVQLDIHGSNSTDNAQIIATLFRDEFACSFFSAYGKALAPLYATDGQQMPFINAESQYEDRWVVQVEMQANPVVSTPQEFASNLTVTLVEVDTAFPVGAP